MCKLLLFYNKSSESNTSFSFYNGFISNKCPCCPNQESKLFIEVLILFFGDSSTGKVCLEEFLQIQADVSVLHDCPNIVFNLDTKSCTSSLIAGLDDLTSPNPN